MKIIYIDEEASRAMFESKFDVMRDEGIEVLAISKVQDAMPAIETHVSTLSAIVLDIIMPPAPLYTPSETNGGKKTGLRLLKDIRNRWPKIPVVVVSVMPGEELAKEAAGLSVSEFLPKPITGSELAVALRRILG
jgi:CheY-like chemotaxis protein